MTLSVAPEVERIISEFGIRTDWPGRTSEIGEQLEAGFDDLGRGQRRDLRDLAMVTIDDEDARDFDDAVYCRAEGSGWHLWVAIADVSHFVLPDTELDREARLRGNSIYLPDRVVPMLPEILSADLCSLKPAVDRLTLVSEIILSAEGTVVDAEFYPAVIHSQARLTYTQVAALLEGGRDDTVPGAVTQMLQELQGLYFCLETLRKRRGSLDIDLPEFRLQVNDGGELSGVVQRQRNIAHRLIEECMLCANVAAAEFLSRHGVETLFRNHPPFEQESLFQLQDNLRVQGIHLPLGRGQEQLLGWLNQLLSGIADNPRADFIRTLVLRSLGRAAYEPESSGHFGLNYERYTHFTSPIRRYPDLLVHRAIKQITDSAVPQALSSTAGVNFSQLGEHLSDTERKADEATREVNRRLTLRLLKKDKIGRELPGYITGVQPYGLFVQLRDYEAEGLLHISHLGRRGYYYYREAEQCLVARRGGERFCLGDQITVTVGEVDLSQYKMSFSFRRR